MYKCLSRNSDAYEDVQTPSASRDARCPGGETAVSAKKLIDWAFVGVMVASVDADSRETNRMAV